MTQAQLAWYRAMEERGELVQIRDRCRARSAPRRGRATTPGTGPIGYVLSLEGADSLVTHRAPGTRLRAGPARGRARPLRPRRLRTGHQRRGRPWRARSRAVREMERLGMILDATHLCDESFRDALDHFHGPVWASHSNCRSLVPHNRQFNDDQIRELVERGAVIGAAFDAWMIVPGWVRGESTPERDGATLERLVDHIDHICQIAGNARHCGIGSDLDGGIRPRAVPVRCRDDRRSVEAAAAAGRARIQRRGCGAHRARELRAVPARVAAMKVAFGEQPESSCRRPGDQEIQRVKEFGLLIRWIS